MTLRAVPLLEVARRRGYSSVAGSFVLESLDQKVVHVFGDSHSRVFALIRRKTKSTRISITTVRGASARGISNASSESCAREIFLTSISQIPATQEVAIQLGEVDCGSLIWRIQDRTGHSLNDLYTESLGRLQKFVGELDRRPVILCGTTPPTVWDYTKFSGDSNPRFGLTASWSERAEITRRWNRDLEHWCSVHGHVFLDVASFTWKPLGEYLLPEYLPESASDHHLRVDSFASSLAAGPLPDALSRCNEFRRTNAR